MLSFYNLKFFFKKFLDFVFHNYLLNLLGLSFGGELCFSHIGSDLLLFLSVNCDLYQVVIYLPVSVFPSKSVSVLCQYHIDLITMIL
jgi:hypothetical protein